MSQNSVNVNITLITEENIPTMVEIWNPNAHVLSSTNRKHTKKSLLEWFQNRSIGNHKYYGIFKKNYLCGFMILKYELDKLIIKMTALASNFQNQGFGKKLISFAKREAQKLNFPVYTEVKIENFRALNFFFSLGFKIIQFDKKWEEYNLLALSS
ncbi:hypothetical protein NEF87_001698 [Candidatus Lokiarchaeum ossiferum]|uniref:N-acetyltransferase domain-containing protein n=1 Tax=Candidatus Lokiarchaeum ossiferum TaxID=2951803 RepID=A0ABY6HPG8_9ARCH|nr:hypothetical protein NEF87_001698 [Candidatus Lokiarchaeum sp. B-35]